jgi:hypothetical protein
LTTSTTSRPLPASPTISTMLELAIRALIASRTISMVVAEDDALSVPHR